LSPQGPDSQGEFAALGVKTRGSQLPSRHQPSGRPHSGPTQIPVGNMSVQESFLLDQTAQSVTK